MPRRTFSETPVWGHSLLSEVPSEAVSWKLSAAGLGPAQGPSDQWEVGSLPLRLGCLLGPELWREVLVSWITRMETVSGVGSENKGLVPGVGMGGRGWTEHRAQPLPVVSLSRRRSSRRAQTRAWMQWGEFCILKPPMLYVILFSWVDWCCIVASVCCQAVLWLT